jgi:geranylgeranyl diphosphate synthase type I
MPEPGVLQPPDPLPGFPEKKPSDPHVREVPEAYVFSLGSSLPGQPCLPAVEWWFVQGYYDSLARGRRHFMCALFRFFRPGDGVEDSGLFHLLISELDPVTRENRVISQADPGIAGWMEGIETRDHDQELYRAYVDELRESGIALPIVSGPAGPSASDDPFSLRWGEFSFRAEETGVVLTYPRPGDGVMCRFSLRPAAPAWWYPQQEGNNSGGMAYASIPRLSLAGTVDGEEISGKAWVDHQWGGTGWFQGHAGEAGESSRVRGWDWYGISLDSGTDLMVVVRREMESGRIYAKEAVIREGRRISGSSSFSIEPSGFWTSPATGIAYPVSARITMPDLDCDLFLAPVADDQELLLPGPMRAVWEGAADVTGIYRGEEVRGRARTELFGYGYPVDFDGLLSSISGKIDREIARFFPPVTGEDGIAGYIGKATWAYEPGVYSDIIAGPAWDLMNRGGKHYRPVFATLLLHTLGVAPEPYFDLICTIPELNHTGALIIDDIEDDSPVRRGEASIHIRHGTGIAINAANTLYYLPWLLVEGHPHLDDRQRLLLYENMVKNAVRVHFGQGMDLFWSRKREPGATLAWLEGGLADKILQMHADKTGVAGEQIAHGCCVIANVPDNVRQSCVRYSRDLWIAFQIMDDIRDITGGPGWKKCPGRDIAGGKLNYVIVRALAMLEAGDQARLSQILSLAPVSGDESLVREGIGLVQRSGAIPVCSREAAGMLERGWRNFSSHIPASDAKVLLRAFSRKIIRS